MPSQIRVNYDQLGSLSRQFTDSANQVNQVSQQASACLDAIRAAWQADSAGPFIARVSERVVRPLGTLSTALDETQRTIDQIAQMMAAAETEASQLFSGGSAGATDVGVGPGAGAGKDGKSSGGTPGVGDHKKDGKEPSDPFKVTPIKTTNSKTTSNKSGTPGKNYQADKGKLSKNFNPSVTLWSQNKTFLDKSVYSQTLADGHVKVSALSVQVTGTAALKLDKNGLDATVKGQAGAYLVRVQAQGDMGPLHVAGDAWAGAQVNGNAGLSVSQNGVLAQVGGDAFVGAKATATGTLKSPEMAGVSASATGSASVSYGLGINGSATAGFKDGDLKFGGSFGATLGVGAGVNFAVDLNVKDAVNTVVHDGQQAATVVTHDAQQFAGNVSNTATSTVKNVASWFGWHP